MKVLCCECQQSVDCEEVKGDVIYPHRPDLYSLSFLRCPICGNYTGKYKGEKAVLPTRYMRECRYKAHRALEKIWKHRKLRGAYYKYMSDRFGRDFHWGEVECDEVATIALELTLNFMADTNEKEKK